MIPGIIYQIEQSQEVIRAMIFLTGGCDIPDGPECVPPLTFQPCSLTMRVKWAILMTSRRDVRVISQSYHGKYCI